MLRRTLGWLECAPPRALIPSRFIVSHDERRKKNEGKKEEKKK